MGLGEAAKMVEQFKSLPNCKKAFKQGSPPLVAREYVAIDDVLTRLFRMRTKDFKYEMSGQQLADEILKPTDLRLNGNCIVSIILMDIPDFVPRRKQWEQKKRTSFAPYEQGTRLWDAGVILPNGKNELVDTRRLAASRHMRKKLIEFVLQHLKKRTYPKGRMVAIDSSVRGVITYSHGTFMAEGKRYKHECGESDMMLAFWSRIYRKRDVLIQTIDNDTMPIMMHYIENVVATDDTHGNLYWVNGKEGYCDLRLLYKGIVQDLNWNARLFAYFCCFGDNDYVPKNLVTYWVGFEDIWQVTNKNKHILKVLPVEYVEMAKEGEQVWLPPFTCENAEFTPRLTSTASSLDDFDAYTPMQVDSKASKSSGDLSDNEDETNEKSTKKHEFTPRALLQHVLTELQNRSKRERKKEDSDAACLLETWRASLPDKPSIENRICKFECPDADIIRAIMWTVQYWCVNWKALTLPELPLRST